MKLVIAGNYEQYRHYISTYQLDPKEFKYVHDETRLMGYHNIEVICTGEYWKNDAYNSMHHRMLLNEFVPEPQTNGVKILSIREVTVSEERD